MIVQQTPTSEPRSTATTAYDLFTDAIEVMRGEPRRVNMGYWVLNRKSLPKYMQHFNRPMCNTVACAAGWFCVLADKPTLAEIPMRGPFPENSPPEADEVTYRLFGLAFEGDTKMTDQQLELRNDLSTFYHDYGMYEDLGDPGSAEYALAVINKLREIQERYADYLRSVSITVTSGVREEFLNSMTSGEE